MKNLQIIKGEQEPEVLPCPVCGKDSICDPCEHLKILDLGEIGGDIRVSEPFDEIFEPEDPDMDNQIQTLTAGFPDRQFLQHNYNVEGRCCSGPSYKAIVRYVWDITKE